MDLQCSNTDNFVDLNHINRHKNNNWDLEILINEAPKNTYKYTKNK